METKTIATATKSLGDVIKRNSPTILTGLGVGGLITTAVMAGKATLKAEQILKQREAEELEINPDFCCFSKRNIIKETWKCYIPTVLMGSATIACMIGANKINLRRNAVLASVYSIAETTLKEYQSKVIETIGEEKEKKIQNSIAQDKINNTKPNTLIIKGDGQHLFLDLTSQRYFRSSVDKVEHAINEINARLIDDTWLCLNEVYGYLDLEPTDLGWEVGWDINRDGLVRYTLDTCMAHNNEPCITFKFDKLPSPRW